MLINTLKTKWFKTLKKIAEAVMAEIRSFQEMADSQKALDEFEELLKRVSDSEEVLGGEDHLSQLIGEYSLQEEKILSKEDLMLAAAGKLDPGDRIWQQILEKNQSV